MTSDRGVVARACIGFGCLLVAFVLVPLVSSSVDPVPSPAADDRGCVHHYSWKHRGPDRAWTTGECAP